MAYKILAITDETHICECCGKSNLKRVVVMQKENGQIVRYGTTCAANANMVSKGTSDLLITVKTYIDKWLPKYADTPEVLIRGIWNKVGLTARLEDGSFQVYMGEWITVA